MIDLKCGDCLKAMLDISDESVDMILCDPPYGTTCNKWDVVIPLHDFVTIEGKNYYKDEFFNLCDKSNLEILENATRYWNEHSKLGMWEQFERIIKPNGAIIIFGSGMFTAKCMMEAPKGMWRYNLVWEKTTPTGFYNAKKMPLRNHEDIMVFYKHPPVYNPQMVHGAPRKVSLAKHKRNCKQSTNYGSAPATSYDSTDRYPKSVWKFKTDKQTCNFHPTQKPLALCEALIKTYSNPGDLIFDPTFGSGTTGVAAINTGRNFCGCEFDLIEYAIGAKRIEDAEYAKDDGE